MRHWWQNLFPLVNIDISIRLLTDWQSVPWLKATAQTSVNTRSAPCTRCPQYLSTFWMSSKVRCDAGKPQKFGLDGFVYWEDAGKPRRSDRRGRKRAYFVKSEKSGLQQSRTGCTQTNENIYNTFHTSYTRSVFAPNRYKTQKIYRERIISQRPWLAPSPAIHLSPFSHHQSSAICYLHPASLFFTSWAWLCTAC